MSVRCSDCKRRLRAGDARTVVGGGREFGDYLCGDCTYLRDHSGAVLSPGERALREAREARDAEPQSETLFGREVA